MNTDKRIRELLNEYAERPSEGLHDRVRDRLAAARRAKRRAVGMRWAFAIACLFLVVLAGLVMVPRAALAGQLRKVHLAIEHAKSVRFTMVRQADGKERAVYWAWIEGDKSHTRRAYTTETAVDCVVKDGRKWTHAAHAEIATEEPYEPGQASEGFDSDVDALEFAKEITAPSGIWAPSNVAFEDHPDVEGRKTFGILADRNDGRIHAEMVVDAESNLPISITMDIRSQAPGSLRAVRTRAVSSFVFNEHLDPRLFEPVFGPSVKIVESSPVKTRSSEVVRESKPGDFISTTGHTCAPEALFSIPYGFEAEQIGLEFGALDGARSGAIGNAGFAIRKGGDLIVADRVNRKVKEFDGRGALVMSTEGDLDDPVFVAPAPDGAVVAVSGPERDVLSKFGRRGEQLWSVRVPDAIPLAMHLAGRLGELSVSDDGLVAAKLDRTEWMVCFSKDGRFDSVRPATSVTSDGGGVSFVPAIDDSDAADAVIMDANGRIVSKTRLTPMSRNASPVRAEDVGEFREALRDEQGCWYRVWIQRKEKRIELAADLQIRSEGVVTKYSAAGEPLAQGVVDSSPFGFPQTVAVDGDGFLYALSYRKDRVSLVRYRLPSPPSPRK